MSILIIAINIKHTVCLQCSASPRDLLGHRVLDLKTRIHFNEVVLSGFVQQKLDSSRILITNMFGETNSISVNR